MDKEGAITRPGRGFNARLFKLVSRLAIWYAIIIVTFRCPASRDDLLASSPLICKPYVAVRSRLAPYVEPYYATYAAPYVDTVRPYAENFHEHIYAPASASILDGYEKYAAPRVAKARVYGEHEWERKVVPRIDQLKGKVQEQYGLLLEPYVKQIDATIFLPLQSAKRAILHQYRTVIIPSYQKSIPYLESAYGYGQTFVIDIGLPYSVWIYDGLVTFVHRRVWPPLRIVYGRNVEPQLSKIRERLSSYRDSKKLEAAVVEMANSSLILEEVEPEPLIESSITTTSDVSTDEAPSSSTESLMVSSTVADPVPSVNEKDGKLTDELKSWQAKFTKASDKGAEDLSIRISVIAARQIEKQADGLGNALVAQLEEASDQALGKLKSVILRAVQALSDDSTEEDQNTGYASVISALRTAGTTIKEKAQELRVWKIEFGRETDSLVKAASDSTLDVIDNIRDLGLQEIGMRWASMDSVTYQDWTEYHTLKKTFDDWRVQVENIASEHEGLAEARQHAESIEDRGMGIAQDAAAELVRLKDVARWKLHAQDASDDFSTRKLPAAAARLGQMINEQVSDASSYIESLTSTQGLAQSVTSVASEGAINAISSASSIVAEPFSQITPSAADTEIKEAAARELKRKEQVASNIITAIRNMESKRLASQTPSASSEEMEPSSQPVLDSMIQAMSGNSLKNSKEDPEEMEEEVVEEEESTETIETDEPLLSTISAHVGSIISQAGQLAGPKAAAVLSEMSVQSLKAETTIDSSEDIRDGIKALTDTMTSVSSVVKSATSQIPEEVSRANEAAKAAAEEYEASAASAYGQASGSIASAAPAASEALNAGADAVESSAASAYGQASSSIVSAAPAASEALHAGEDAVESSAESVYDWASATIEDAASAASEAITAATEEYQSSGESAYSKVSATVVNAASIGHEDFVDMGRTLSESIQSEVSEAGEDYSTVTRTLHRASTDVSESPEP